MFTVAAPDPSSATKAVVIMYGWLGAQPKHLQKYADMYVTQMSCTVIHGTASVTGVMLRDKNEMAAAVTESVQKAALVIREIEKAGEDQESADRVSDNTTSSVRVPVIVHYFSNGGAYVAEQLENMIQKAKSGGSLAESDTSSNSANSDNLIIDDLKLVANRLQQTGCEIADSAPVYMHVGSAMNAITTAVPSLPRQLFVKTLFVSSVFLKRCASYIAREETEPVIFWNNMIKSELCPRQAFIYSSADELTDAAKLDDLIIMRKERGVKVTVLKFDDSNHVLHYRRHPKQYIDFVMQQIMNSKS
jgi:hypothetical protein